MKSALSAKHFHDEEAAFAYLESIVWPEGPICPRCGNLDAITKVRANPKKRIRIGLWRCGPCKRQFSAKVGSVFEHMRLPLHKALQAVFLLSSAKKGISAHQLHRTLGITYKAAWFLSHRIREAMREGFPMFGQGGGIVEADEGFIGTEPDVRTKGYGRAAYTHKMKVLALIDRDTGRSHARVINFVAADIIRPILQETIQPEATIVTDASQVYNRTRKHFARHEAISHRAGEYGRGEFHTNNLEAYFSVFKRGMKGIYQHCGKQHLQRYLSEFDFRYSNREALGVNDIGRTVRALQGVVGKRLMYRQAVAK